MKVSEIRDILNAEVFCGDDPDYEVEYGFGCDLMSDVLAFVNGDTVLLTGAVNPQVIRTCEVVDIHVIVFVRGKKPSEDLIDLAECADIQMLGTNYSLYETCGILHAAGLHGEEIENDF